jgi:hypothetical protein
MLQRAIHDRHRIILLVLFNFVRSYLISVSFIKILRVTTMGALWRCGSIIENLGKLFQLCHKRELIAEDSVKKGLME